ncbi:uncharacterized protein LOC131428121 [Malaya genurostris]|uniref:uncharacterized protein LOC131428121 n=1 Tax=Malaya genurostris TaxID=325434 RepID=UPI0026F38432|nr:uncharacterized protein LOC131428121 [Malaya genurostris]
MSEEENDTPRTAAVSVKLPEFWKTDPEMWFAQAEAQFVLGNVTKDETKFYHIIAKVDHSAICHIAELVANPPLQEKYKAIKDRLIARFALSPQARFERLLGSSDLGDMRPTQLLSKMQELANGLNVNDDLLKMLFLQRMPAHIRPVLTISDGTLAKLAEMADKMAETPQTAAVSIKSEANEEMQKIKEQLEVLSTELRRFKPGLTQDIDRRRGRSSSRSRSESEVCWYHRKYGKHAERCKQPCNYNQPKN